MLFERDDDCRMCYGKGYYDDYSNSPTKVNYIICECEGTGKQLTEVGKELVKFLREVYGLVPRGEQAFNARGK